MKRINETDVTTLESLAKQMESMSAFEFAVQKERVLEKLQLVLEHIEEDSDSSNFDRLD